MVGPAPAPKPEYALARHVGVGQARRWCTLSGAIATKAIDIYDLMSASLDHDASSAGGNAASGASSSALELELRNVQKQYPGQRAAAIPDLSLNVPAGEVCVLVGPVGVGQDDRDAADQPHDPAHRRRHPARRRAACSSATRPSCGARSAT